MCIYIYIVPFVSTTMMIDELCTLGRTKTSPFYIIGVFHIGMYKCVKSSVQLREYIYTQHVIEETITHTSVRMYHVYMSMHLLEVIGRVWREFYMRVWMVKSNGEVMNI